MSPLIIATLLVALMIVIGFLRKRPAHETQDTAGIPTSNSKSIPDLPRSFGYKCLWLAVKTTDIEKLAALLPLKNSQPCNWLAGIDAAYNGAVFIAPPVDGWTLIVGHTLPAGDSEESVEEVKALLQPLSREFGEAQFFCTHRVTEFHCWMKAVNGQVLRVYSYLGEAGENIAVEGEPTPVEAPLNLVNSFLEEAQGPAYFERTDLTTADEELVMKIAGSWSIDPTQLENRKDVAPALGLLGSL